MLKVRKNYPLSKLTTLKIGGPAKFFFIAKNKNGLFESVKWAKNKNLPYIVIGNGSNLLVSDKGFKGLIIKYTESGIKQEDGFINVKSGTSLQKLVDFTIREGLDGMSTMNGVPGTVGGAVYGSAGAYGDNIRDYLKNILCFDGQKTVTITKKEYSTGYRDSFFKHHKNYIILEANYTGFPHTNSKNLLKESREILKLRQKKYPNNTKCPGSFFKNIIADNLPPKIKNSLKTEVNEFGKIPAGRLVELVGGRGDKIGCIQISPNHGNTFVNLGGGTANDFYKLAKKYHKKVKERFGIVLEPEVQFINLPPLH